MSRRNRQLFSPKVGHVNVAVYGPGESCTALPGDPVFTNHAVRVFWFPGIPTTYTLHATLGDAERVIAARDNYFEGPLHSGEVL